MMIEVICNDRLGKKVRVKCNDDDTIGDLKKLIAAQTGKHPLPFLARVFPCGVFGSALSLRSHHSPRAFCSHPWHELGHSFSWSHRDSCALPSSAALPITDSKSFVALTSPVVVEFAPPCLFNDPLLRA